MNRKYYILLPKVFHETHKFYFECPLSGKINWRRTNVFRISALVQNIQCFSLRDISDLVHTSNHRKQRKGKSYNFKYFSFHLIFCSKWSKFERILGPNQQLDTFNGIFCAFSWVDFKTNMLKSIQHFAWGAMSTVQLLDCSSVMHEKVEERKKTNEYRTFVASVANFGKNFLSRNYFLSKMHFQVHCILILTHFIFEISKNQI